MTSDADLRAQLAAIQESQPGMWNISPEEGEFLCNLVLRTGARKVVEIGTSNGYSAAWWALGLRQTGGMLITLESDPGRHALARSNFEALGLASYIDARLGDAFEQLRTIEGPIDIGFIDARKQDYLAYFDALLPKVRAGGLLLAHNVVSHAAELEDFLVRIHTDPEVRTEILTVGPKGLSVSTRR